MARKWVAHQLHRLAERIDHENRTEILVVKDEYDICRCRVEVRVDDLHGIEAAFEQLPSGWILGGIEHQQSNPYRPNSY